MTCPERFQDTACITGPQWPVCMCLGAGAYESHPNIFFSANTKDTELVRSRSDWLPHQSQPQLRPPLLPCQAGLFRCPSHFLTPSNRSKALLLNILPKSSTKVLSHPLPKIPHREECVSLSHREEYSPSFSSPQGLDAPSYKQPTMLSTCLLILLASTS